MGLSLGDFGLGPKAGLARHEHPPAPQTDTTGDRWFHRKAAVPGGTAFRAARPPWSLRIVRLGISGSLRASSMFAIPCCVVCMFAVCRSIRSMDPSSSALRGQSVADSGTSPFGDSNPSGRAAMTKARPHLRFANESGAPEDPVWRPPSGGGNQAMHGFNALRCLRFHQGQQGEPPAPLRVACGCR